MNKFAIIALCMVLCTISISGLGVIRPIPDINGDVHLKIPRGGAIVKPVAPINNSAQVTMSFVIDGQACDLNDPLIFYFDVVDTESGNDVILNFPSDFFLIHGCCGGSLSSVNVRYWGELNLRTYWDGNLFADETDVGCCD